MNKWLALLPFFIVACAGAASTPPQEIILPTVTNALPDLGPAPELTNETWLNVDAPLRLADLRGKVVAIDMWTFG